MYLHKAYRSIALFMAVMLLFTTSGITMDMHFCQGKLKRINLFGKAKTCEEVAACMKKCGKKVKSCHMQKVCVIDGDHKGCCENEAILIDYDFDSFAPIFVDDSTQDNQLFLYTECQQVFNMTDVMLNNPAYLNYKPPLIFQDLPVLHQVFLL